MACTYSNTKKANEDDDEVSTQVHSKLDDVLSLMAISNDDIPWECWRWWCFDAYSPMMHSLWWWSRPWRHVQFARPFDDDDSVWIMSDWCLSSTNSIHWHWLRYVHDTYTVNIQRYIEIYSICIYVDTVVDTYIKVSTVYNEYRGVWIVMFTMVK